MQNCILFGAADRGICLLSGALARSGYRMGGIADWEGGRTSTPLFGIAQTPDWARLVLAGRARAVCVFDEPGRAVASLLQETPTDFDPQRGELTSEKAMAWWCSVYRDILTNVQSGGDWMFLDACEVESGRALAPFGRFLGGQLVAATSPEPLPEAESAHLATDEALQLYARLCALAEAEGAACAALPPGGDSLVSVLVHIGPDEEASIPGFLEAAAAQQGVSTELIFLNQTGTALTGTAGARVIACSSPSRGAAWKLGAQHASADYVAWWLPGCRPLPTQLAEAMATLEAERSVDFVTCTHALHDESGEFVERIHGEELPQTPAPYWECGAVMRKSVIEELEATAFFPVELALWRALRGSGRCAHVMTPGFSVNKWIHKARWESSRLDGDLLAQAQLPYTGDSPQLTVSICSQNNRAGLLRCLEGFSRQILPRGAYEIVVVLDGRVAGAEEFLRDLELPVPHRSWSGKWSGHAAARNQSVQLAEGHLVLIAEDDTIPLPDHVGQHLKAHAAHQEQGALAVVGALRHSQRALSHGLVRHLDGSHADFPPELVAPNEFQAMNSFYDCPISLPTEIVRLAGGFDTTYETSGCEARDLWLRVDALGIQLHYEPDAIVLRDEVLTFAELRGRQVQLAKSHVEFFRKNPQVLSVWGLENLTLAACEASVNSTALSVPIWEQALAGLCAFDLGSLERVGGDQSTLATQMLRSLDELLSGVNRVWWHAGYAEGMRLAGVASFAELARSDQDWDPIRSEAERRLFAWPRWDESASLDRMMHWTRPLARDGFGALVVLLNPECDLEQSEAFANLEAAYSRVYGQDPSVQLEVVVEVRALCDEDLEGLCLAVDGFLVLGGEPEEFLHRISTPTLSSAADVEAWRSGLEGGSEQAPSSGEPSVLEPLAPPQQEASPGLEPAAPSDLAISVIVPTHNRSRELVQLIECLTRQDLDPALFEVIVVDDGSREPACQRLGPMRTAFDLQVITQRSSGPGAARNRAIELAKADLIVFFNDDAVPAPDCLRKHLEVQRASDGKHAVMGTFSLLPELVVDSFTAHVESSRALFAQPLMTSGTSYAGTSFCTGNLSIARRVLVAVGGFDESFRYAGGEDSELGLRLDRELGWRVLFDASVRSEHDHELRLRGFLKRMRVIGWAAYRIEKKHGNTGLVQGQPTDAAGWQAMRELLHKEESILTEILEAAEDACRREREGGLGPVTLESYRDIYEMIAGYGMRCGILAGHEGALPCLSDEVLAIAAA